MIINKTTIIINLNGQKSTLSLYIRKFNYQFYALYAIVTDAESSDARQNDASYNWLDMIARRNVLIARKLA